MIFLLPRVVAASENTEHFAAYDKDRRVLSLNNVAIAGTFGMYYNRAALYLGIDGTWGVTSLSQPQVNDLPELALINSYDPASRIISMPLVEVDDAEAYRNVKIQLGSQWRILQIEDENCDFTKQQAKQLQACMTLDEIENVAGCPGIFMGGYLGEKKYKWRNLSVTVQTSVLGVERASTIRSNKHSLFISCQQE